MSLLTITGIVEIGAPKETSSPARSVVAAPMTAP